MTSNKILKFLFSSIILAFILQMISLYFFSNEIHYINSYIFFGTIGNNEISYIISILMILVLVFLFFLNSNFYSYWTVFIICGAFSNIIDRFIYGGVVDYISFANLFYFNIADIIIIIGLTGLCYKYLKTKLPDKDDPAIQSMSQYQNQQNMTQEQGSTNFPKL